jgi:uncharacterized protein YnzC (UPF0291/DUF896 family)
MTMKYIKCLYHIPNGNKIYRHFQFQGPPKFTQIGIIGLKNTIWQPWRYLILRGRIRLGHVTSREVAEVEVVLAAAMTQQIRRRVAVGVRNKVVDVEESGVADVTPETLKQVQKL